MKKDFNPDEQIEYTGPAENEGLNQEGFQTEETQQRKSKKDKQANRGKQNFASAEEENAEATASAGEEPVEEQWEQGAEGGEEGVEGEDEVEGDEEEEFEGEEDTEGEEEDEETPGLEEQIDAISEKVKNYIMSSDTKKMKDLVKYGSLAALAVYGLRRGGLLRGLVISAAVSMAAKHLLGEETKEAA